MHVNKYVPHYQRIPLQLDKEDFAILEDDLQSFGERIKRASKQVKNFDSVLNTTLIENRKKRYREQNDDKAYITKASHQPKGN